MPRLLLLFLILLSLAALPALAKPDALPPPVVPQCVGVNIHFTGQPKPDLDGLARGGFGWVRMDFFWSDIEKTKGVYDFSAYDSLLAGLTVRHIKPLFILDYGNDLYEKGSPSTHDARAAFARFAAAAAKHYRGRTILWELWNEPNGGFWQPRADVAAYGALALATAKAIKAADPDATVLAPGTSGIPLDFLESLFKQGLLNDIDAVSVHPYRSSGPETTANDFLALRLLIHRYAPQGKNIPLVSSEWGYTTVNVTEQQQAQYLAREWLSNLAEGVRPSIWYDWHDDGTDPKNGEHHFGTVRNDYSPKPAFLAAQTFTHALSGYRFLKRIPLASPDDYLLLFTHGPNAQKLVAWTTQADHGISLPIPRTPRMVDFLGAPVPSAISQGRLQLTLTGSPVYLDAPTDAALRQAAAWTVQPLDPIYTEGQPLSLTLTYHDPDAVSHRVRFLVLLTTPDGARTPVASGEDIVGPQQTLALGTAPATLARVAIHARIGLVVDGVRQPYPQDVTFTPADPLTLAVVPVSANAAQAQIANPGGTAFDGQLNAAGPNGIFSIPIQLTAGETARTVPVAAPAGAAWRLRDGHGRLIASLPARRFVSYPLTPPLSVTLDGDPKVPSTVQMTPGQGTPAVRYQFAPGWSFWRVGEAQPPPLPGRPAAYGVWVSGDGSDNNVNVRFLDATGQTFQVNGPRVDWTGWRFVSFPLQPDTPGGPLSYWGGANDGNIHFPLRMTSLVLLDSRPDALRHQGVIVWKQPMVVYTAPPASAPH